jgi:tetratricopeptide (TPR) repeat protein
MRNMLSALLLLMAVALTTFSFQQSPSQDFARRSPPQIPPEAKRTMESQLDEARKNLAANPKNPDALIWVGRRLGYLGRFAEAIEVYTKGVKEFPNDARFYRHRGHRYITLRKFAFAIADLKRATKLRDGLPDEIEPDGQPNARNIPTSTLHFNIWYHLGLAYYLSGQTAQALRAYQECFKVSKNADALVATSHWLYMTQRRLGRTKAAAALLANIPETLEIIENTGYYRLLLMYKGQLTAPALLEEASKEDNGAGAQSIFYGIGNWYLYNGKRDEALSVFRRMLATDQWTSFGYIAAEADIDRISIR